MDDKHKTKAQLISELEELRRRVAQVNRAAAPHPNLHPTFLTWADKTSSTIFIWQDSEFRYTNPAMSRLTGYAPQELIGRNVWSLIHPEFRELIQERVAAWQRGDSVPARSEFKILTKSGEARWVNADSTFIEFDGCPAALTIAFDSTEHKLAEEALNASEERYRNIVETAQEGIWMVDAQAKTTYVNQRLAQMFGCTRDEMLGLSVFEFVADAARQEARVLLERGRQGTKGHYDFRFVRKDGSDLWTIVSTTPLFDGEGRFAGGLAMLVDVTQHHWAEAALRESEERFRKLVNSMNDIVFTVDQLRRYNGAFGRRLERFGFERGAFLGKTAIEALGAEDGRVHDEANRRGLSGEEVVYEWSSANTQGTFYFQTCLSPIRNRSGEVIELVGVSRDITERKRAEDALRRSEERYRDMVENARDIIYSHDLMGNYTSVNKAVEQITGYTREEALKRNFEQTVAPEYVETARKMIAAKLAGQKETVYDLEIMAKNGQRVTLEVNTRLVLQDGVPVGIQGIARDVTQRKRAEEALRHSEERFRRYFELGLIGMAIMSPAKGFIEANEKMCEILGYERAELLQLTWDELTHPDDLAADLADFGRAMAGEPDGYSTDKRFIRKDRGVIDAAFSISCVRRPDRSVDSFIVLLDDVTERKHAEQALRKSESHLQAILDNCPALIFQKDLDGRYLQFNRQFQRFNLPPEQVIGRTDDELFPPEIAAAFKATDRSVLEAGRTLEFEESAVYADGVHNYIVHKFPLMDAAGNIYAVGAISTDITEHKRAEDDLRKQKEILQKIFDHIPVMVRFLDEDGRIRLVNREWERTLGWSLEEIETGDLDIFAELYPDPQYRQEVLNFIAASTGEFTDLKTRARDGRVIDTTFANVRLEDGTNIGIGRDITDLNRAADLLRRQAAQLAALHEIELEISAESDLSRILEVVTRRAAELLDASHCFTFIRERDEAALTLVASLESKFIGLRLEAGDGLAGRALITGQSQRVHDYSQWQGRAHAFDAEGFGPSIAAPLKWQQTVIGAISLSRKCGEELFSGDDSQLLEQLAAEAAIAIHQATLFDEMQGSQRRLQILSRRLIDAQEVERKRLSRELHDQIGQALTAVQISLQALQSSCDAPYAGPLTDCLTIIDDALRQVHDLSLDLRPSLLDDLGLIAALRWYVDRVASRAGLVTHFNADVIGGRLPPQVETACFRIAQEALTNVLRHAQAATVWVQVTQQDSGLQLVVRDNGAGFDVLAAMNRTGVDASLGLQGMQERAAALDGNVEIKSHAGNGVEVLVRFPLAQALCL